VTWATAAVFALAVTVAALVVVTLAAVNAARREREVLAAMARDLKAAARAMAWMQAPDLDWTLPEDADGDPDAPDMRAKRAAWLRGEPIRVSRHGKD
jgi:hypothetical protein